MRNLYLALLACAVSTPAYAAEDAQDKRWEIGVSGGTTLIGDGDDQFYIAGSITREIGDAYIGISASFTDPSETQGLLRAVPARTQQITVIGGIGLNAVSIDGRISLGRRKFDTESLGSDGNVVLVDSSGEIFGAGLSLTYDIPVGENGFFSPSISADYDSVDIGRLATTPGGRLLTVEEREDGVSGALAFSYVHLFGKAAAHSAGPYVAVVASSNSTVFSPGIGGERMAQLAAIRNAPGQGDIWMEVGGSASFGLSDNLRLSLSATQTLGFIGPEATSLGAGLSISF